MSPVSYSVRFSVGGLLAFVVAFAAPPVPVAAGPSDPLLADGQGAGPPEIVPGHKEEVGDAPGSAPARVPAAPGATRSTWTRGPYTSVQVNVDALGNNIPGDAANEPSIAVDPTAPGRLVIGWRQFDTVASNFRQAGWAYSHDGGHTWTFPGVLEPGEFSSDPVLTDISTSTACNRTVGARRGPATSTNRSTGELRGRRNAMPAGVTRSGWSSIRPRGSVAVMSI